MLLYQNHSFKKSVFLSSGDWNFCIIAQNSKITVFMFEELTDSFKIDNKGLMGSEKFCHFSRGD